LFVEVSKLKTQNAFAEPSTTSQLMESNLSSIRLQLQLVKENFSLAKNLVGAENSRINSTFDMLIELLNQTQQANSKTDVKIQQLNNFVNKLHSGYYQASPVSSCAALNDFPWSSPSGHYWVRASNGSAVRVYCDMTRSCGNVTGGWMRVAELDMTNSSHRCPGGFRQRNDSDRLTCVRTNETSGCHQGSIPTHNLSYSKACGRIIAYQVGSTDAFLSSTSSLTIDENYVDGISLTHGNPPRQHIWTFAAGANRQPHSYTCPCIEGSPVTPPPFVGEDYFCETGNTNNTRLGGQLFLKPLWDGEGCGDENVCCSFNTPPWFYKQLPEPTTDDIEVRVCTDELGGNL
jgi:hypothetical protein